ncbi:FkbM family methyltransferase [Amycolatopsis silviterrae]|uniref:FkbM family methyltransferase n=1 Tax=Amycolatopsis silviterrae TaxID=1656914 RepID=A0ABW5H394_9PSEU
MTDTVDHLGQVGDLAEDCVVVRNRQVFAVPGPAAPTVRRACALRDETELSLFEPDDDLMLFHRNRREADFIFREVFRDNEYLRNGITLPERPTIVDVGANVGGASVLFGLVRPEARIIAVEPVPSLCRAVERNAALHGLDLTVVPSAVGAARGKARFTYYPKNTAMSGLLADQEDRDVLKTYLAGEDAPDGLDALVAELLAGETIECDVLPLGEALLGHRIERVDLLKIDVEKAEWQVLQGIGDDLWRRVDQVAMEVHDVDGRVAACVRLLSDKGFHVLVDRNQELLNTNMHSVYARRGPVAPEIPEMPWRKPLSTSRALAAALRAELGDELPVERFRFLAALPKDGRGQLDVAALLAEIPDDSPAEAGAPEIEEKLAAIWRRVLKVPEIAASDDFFDLGGTSLRSVRMVLEVDEAFGPDVLPPDQLFEGSRFDQVVAIIRGNLK